MVLVLNSLDFMQTEHECDMIVLSFV